MNVILDAAFLDLENRRMARQVARSCNVRCVMVNAVVDEKTLVQRLERRDAGRDTSEADLAVLQHQLTKRDPLEADELAMTITVDTAAEVDATALATRIRELKY
jgi:predicted kinase